MPVAPIFNKTNTLEAAAMLRKLYQFYSNVLLKGFILPRYYNLMRGSFKMFGIFAKVSVSQFGEDILIDIILKNAGRKKGMFVDVGCNHPIEYNNTYLLYLKGWRGISIDGNAGLIDLHRKFRKKDISLATLVSDKETEVNFQLSTKDKISSIDTGNDSANTLPGKVTSVKMKTRTLNDILEEHLSKFNQPFELLCVDVERHDVEVINSIDLDKYRPYLIVVEMLDFSVEGAGNSPVYQQLTQKGYEMTHLVHGSGFFTLKA